MHKYNGDVAVVLRQRTVAGRYHLFANITTCVLKFEHGANGFNSDNLRQFVAQKNLFYLLCGVCMKVLKYS